MGPGVAPGSQPRIKTAYQQRRERHPRRREVVKPEGNGIGKLRSSDRLKFCWADVLRFKSSQGRDVYDCEWTEIMTREEGADLESLLLKTRWQTVRVAKTLYWAMTTGDSSDGTQMRIMSEESFHETESFDYGTNETAAYAGLFVDQIHLAVERCLYAALKRNETGFKNDRNL